MPSRLRSFADELARSTWRRHLLFAAATCVTILLLGYHIGTFDQIVHLPSLRKYADPSLYPGDPFLELRVYHYSYFWLLFLPLLRLGMLEVAMFAVHVAATYLTFWALWVLSDTLFRDPLASFIGVLAFIFPHVSFAGFTTFEWSLLNRTFVLPFLLWAFILFLRRRYELAFALLGLLYNLHILSVNFVLAMLLFDALLQFRRTNWRRIGLGLALFVLCALPVILWRARNTQLDLSLRPEWLSLISAGMMYNIFHLISREPLIILVTTSGLSSVGLFFIGRRRPLSDADRSVTHFIYAALVTLAAEVIMVEWLPITGIVQLQIVRIGLYASIFGYLYFARYLAGLVGTSNRLDLGLQATMFLLSSTPLAPFLVRVMQRLRWQRFLVVAAAAVMAGANLVAAFQPDTWSPGIHIYPQRTPWYNVQTWARDNTPRDALFLAPPYIWGRYQADWRVFSERSTVVTLPELLEIPFVPEYATSWLSRLEDVAPGAFEQFEGNYFDNAIIAAKAFNSLSDGDILRVARKYGVSYLVMEKPHLRGFSAVYENQGFVVYDLRTTHGLP